MSYQVQISSKVVGLLGIGVGLSIGMFTYYYNRYWKRSVQPQIWQPIGTLSRINIFPVKSCAPITLEPDTEVDCDILGMRFRSIRDRGLMLVDEQNTMVTARIYPKMVLIKTTVLEEAVMQFSSPEQEEDLVLNLGTMASETITRDIHTMVHSSPVDGMLCGEKYDKWFSQAILQKDNGLKLIYYAFDEPVRNVQPRMKTEPYLTKQDTGTFNDATSFMLINLASVEDLNTRTKSPVQALQFRANFELKMDSPEAFAEDHWQWLKIGDEAIFRVVSPCTRCIFTNIDPLTGERNADKEPLKVLQRYRKWPKYPSPVMGIHLGLRQAGKVKQNDIIYIG